MSKFIVLWYQRSSFPITINLSDSTIKYVLVGKSTLDFFWQANH